MATMQDSVTTNTANVGLLQVSLNSTVEKLNVFAKDEANKQAAIHRCEMQSIRSEQQSKKYNMILGNIPEKKNPSSRYMGETKEQSIGIVKDTLKTVFKIREADDIIIADAHRIPGRSAGPRDLIFRVTQMIHKQLIWDNLSVLTAYNTYQAKEGKVYIDMNHLPSKLVRDKMSLKPRYKTLKDDKKQPKWFYDKKTVEYCIKVGDSIIRPEDNFDYKVTITDAHFDFETALPPVVFQ